jgi:hypothetical protein
MRVLLLGEYSSLHNNLKDGLLELGHDVTIAAHADGWKQIARDLDFDSTLPSILGKLHRRVKPFQVLPRLRGFDVVQLVNPFIFYKNWFPSLSYIQAIINANEKSFMLACGDDAYFWRYGRMRLRYGPFDDFLKYDLRAERYYMEDEASLRFNREAVARMRGIIPIMYEYEVSYAEAANRLNTIAIPVNVNKIKYSENRPSEKLVVFHGLNRYGAKGTRHVEEAFDILSKKYPNDLELIIDGKMPLDRYLELMRKTNVVIDQTNSYSVGVNGVFALAMGKVVLGGAEPESLASFGLTSSPVLNIEPNAVSIVTQIEGLLEKKSEIPRIGFESRKYAEEVHSHIKVANTYLDTWRSN